MSYQKQYIAYSRCSTDEQQKRGNSHEYQVEGIRRAGLVSASRMQEAAYFHDTVTGTRFDNRGSGLDAAYRLCERKRGQIDYLFVYRWDRLGRDVSECFNSIKKFLSVGTEVNCPDEWIDFTDPSYPLILSVKFGMAQSESMRISDRTRDGQHHHRMAGLLAGKPPLGYVKGEERPINGKMRSVCEADPAKAPLIRQCFERYAKGATKAELMREFSEALGVRKSQFERMFHNPFYAGYVYVNAHRSTPAQLVVGQHAPIISRELYDECQRVQAEQAHPSKGKTWSVKKTDPINSPEFFLKGVLKCPLTGRAMTAYYARGKSGRRYPYYVPQRNRQRIAILATRAHALVNRAIIELAVPRAHQAFVRGELSQAAQSARDAAMKAATEAKRAMERTNARLDTIRRDYADGGLSAVEYREMRRGFESDALNHERKLQAAEVELTHNDDTILLAVNLLFDLETLYSASDPAYKNRILRALFPEGFTLDMAKGHVLTPCLNEILRVILWQSMTNEVLKIENGTPVTECPVPGDRGGKYQTHFNALKLLFAA